MAKWNVWIGDATYRFETTDQALRASSVEGCRMECV